MPAESKPRKPKKLATPVGQTGVAVKYSHRQVAFSTMEVVGWWWVQSLPSNAAKFSGKRQRVSHQGTTTPDLTNGVNRPLHLAKNTGQVPRTGSNQA
ncbi:MAG: hypothetical protein F6K65_41940 [Moorea sp. SIO3C2]|nr:hypothetical protein [Moorena sp. SIO3C2]